MTDIARNLETVRERIRNARIRAGRVDRVELIAVTKNHPITSLAQAVALGVEHVGENRVQEALEKKAQYTGANGCMWHLIGLLQRNKAAQAVRTFDLIQSIDSERLLRAVDAQAAKAGKIQDVLLQFNIAEEPQKHGFRLSEYDAATACIKECGNVRLRGLMCMAPFYEDAERTRPVFRIAYHIYEEMKRCFPNGEIDYLSMGMSNDFEVAIEEGANLVRVGTAVFGVREY